MSRNFVRLCVSVPSDSGRAPSPSIPLIPLENARGCGEEERERRGSGTVHLESTSGVGPLQSRRESPLEGGGSQAPPSLLSSSSRCALRPRKGDPGPCAPRPRPEVPEREGGAPVTHAGAGMLRSEQDPVPELPPAPGLLGRAAPAPAR